MERVETLRQTNWVFATITIADFFATNGDVFGCLDADVYLVTRHGDDRHRDVVADDHRLTHSSRQYQHGQSLALIGMRSIVGIGQSRC